ncbi:MAG: hypothetical protein M3273_03470 [Actinomycetota bacterium]|nr:hypothetical protein [Actinomycetota bacterium]
MDGTGGKFRRLFIEELAEIRGGNPELADMRPLEEIICGQMYTTLACGEESGPCAPSGC